MLIEQVKQAVNGRWPEVLGSLGISVPKTNGKSACPSCGGSDRFHFMDKHGDGTWYCRGANTGGDGVALVAYVESIGQLDAAKKIASVIGVTDEYDREAIERNKKKAARMRKEREARESKEAEEGARLARQVWKEAEPAAENQPYLEAKQINPHGAKVLTKPFKNGKFTTFAAGTLVIPCCDFSPKGQVVVRSLEFISTTKKQALVGGKRKACFYPLDGSATLSGADMIVVCEGFATGASIRESIGCAVVCAFTRVGLKPVAKKLSERYKGAQIVIAADNDLSGDGQRDAESTGFPFFIPPFTDEQKQAGLSDWNDWKNSGHAIEFTLPEIEEPDEIYIDTLQEYDQSYDEPTIQISAKNEIRFKILGYKDELFYFMPKASQQVAAFSAAALTRNNLLALAPLEYWTTTAGLAVGDKIKPEHWEMHVNGIIQTAYKVGIFDPTRIRGRGAWIDNRRNFLHVGSTIYIDGHPTPVDQVDSAYLYPRNVDMSVKYTKPATNKAAHKLYEICNRLSWERELSGALLAGWCVIAPLCGMVDWRPHIWVTGASGLGKSTVMNDILGVMVGEIGIKVEGNTSEAGIRQMLGNDARPVLFDEAEAEDEVAARRIKQILDFARMSSSGGKIIKGTAGQKAIEFVARSAFCFSSINTSIKEMADEARITRLVLRRDTQRGSEYYEQLENDIATHITPDFANAMLSRSIENMHVIQQNISVFIRAATRVFKSRRIADQVGTLLAGTYFLHSTNVITIEKATEWIASQDWDEHTIINAASDSDRLLQRIVTHRITVIADGQRHEVTIAEAVDASINPKNDNYRCADDFSAEINRYGIKVTDSCLIVANNSEALKTMLKNTPWSSSWSRSLSDIEGAKKSDKPVRFGTSGIVSRGVEIPLGNIL